MKKLLALLLSACSCTFSNPEFILDSSTESTDFATSLTTSLTSSAGNTTGEYKPTTTNLDLPISTTENSISTETIDTTMGSTSSGLESSGASTETTDSFTECGNSIVEGVEECDDGIRGSGECNINCTFSDCGDSILNLLTEECDDGNDIDVDDCSIECKNPRIAFLTIDYIGLPNFGGIQQADNFCQNDAEKAGLSGKFKAWLSDDNSENDPLIRFNSVSFQGWYKLPSQPPTLLVKGWDGLQGDLQNPLNVMPNGLKDNKDPPLLKVFNATGPDGKKQPASSTCNNWTNVDINLHSYVGSAQETGVQWYAYGNTSCGSETGGKLYCFQVE